MRRIALSFAILLAGCNTAPQVVQQGDGDEIVSLPNGAAVILRRRQAEPEPPTCWVRARGFHGLTPMPCDLAERARP